MNLNELTKHPSEMSQEELENRILSIIEDMTETVYQIEKNITVVDLKHHKRIKGK